MCQVSSGELSLVDACVDLCIDFVERSPERVIDGTEDWKGGGEAGTEQTIIEAGEEQSSPEAEFGNAIAEAIRHALDHAMKTQTAELVGDRTLRKRFWIATGQSGQVMPQIG